MSTDGHRPAPRRTAEEILEYVASRIGHVYRRPLMYGGTADGVDVVLRTLHDLYAQIVDRHDDLIPPREDLVPGVGSAGFAFHYRQRLHAGRTVPEPEAAAYVVEQWQRIDERLGVVFRTPDGLP